MKKKIKICFVIVNRANYGRVRILLKKLNKNPKFKLQLVLCSSTVLYKYGNINEVIRKDRLKPNFKIHSNFEGENLISMTKSAGHLISDLTTCFENLNPDMIVTIGDRFETIATAITATYLNKYLVHIQGGELSGSIDESIRHAVTKFAHLHLAATNKSRKNIIQMGENPKNVFNVGCPSIDEISKINFNKKVNLLDKSYGGGTGNLVDLRKKYLICLVHPNTKNYKDNEKLINNVINSLIKLKMQCIFLWPNIDAGSNFISKKLRSLQQNLKENLKINFYKNFENDDYYRLLKNSSCLVGNSSSGIRESSYLGVPVVNIGDRQQHRERGKNVLDVKNDEKAILKAIKVQSNKRFKSQKIYGDGNSSDRMIKILSSVDNNINKIFHKK